QSGRLRSTAKREEKRSTTAPEAPEIGQGEHMNIHEYQGKELFASYGIDVGPQYVATTPAEARSAQEKIGGTVVIKAQVLVGGRGKAGGVKVAKTADEAEARARDILALTIKE